MLAMAFPAHGSPACKERRQVVGHLAKKYSEAPVALGLDHNKGGIIEVLTSKHGETWTILMTLPNGQSCLIAAGESWATLPFVLPTGASM